MNLPESISSDILRAFYSRNFPEFAQNMLKIRDTDGFLRQFVLNPEQKYMHYILRLLRARPYPALIRVFKARKRGMSTYFAGDMFHQFQYTNRQRWGLIFGHEEAASINLFNIIKTFYDYFPESERWPLDSDTKKTLQYGEGSPKSKIEVKTIGGKGEARSSSADYVLMTETSRYGTLASSIVSGVLSGVELKPHVTIVQESTSNGFDSYWQPNHDRFEKLVEKLSREHGIRATFDEELRGRTTALKLLEAGKWPTDEFFHVFIPWFWNPDNQRPIMGYSREEFAETLSDYERAIMQRYKLSLEQINWRREKKKVNCDNDEQMTRQEYPCSTEESFISSGSSIFNQEKLDIEANLARTLHIATDPEVDKINSGNLKPEKMLVSYNLHYKVPPKEKRTGIYTGIFSTDVQEIAIKDLLGSIIEFNPPEPDWKNRYVIGVDCAGGLATGDDDALVVFDRVESKVVAMLAGKYGIDYFPEQIAMLATRYNWAHVLVENNNMGEGVIMRLNQLYPYVMLGTRTKRGIDEILPTAAFGIKTTGPTKTRLIGNLKAYIDNIPVTSDGSYIPFVKILEQCQSFVRIGNTDSMGADGNKNDDLVMALAISLEADRIMSWEGLMPKRKHKKGDYPTLAGIPIDTSIRPPSPKCY